MKNLPYCIKIELVRGCNRRCPFCSINTMAWKDEPYTFMMMETLRGIVDELKEWRPKVRFEIDERGEPTYHPMILDVISYTRQELPEAQITIITNGDLAMEKKLGRGFIRWLDKAFEFGLNIAVLDCYNTDRYEQFSQWFPAAKDFYRDGFNPFHYQGPKIKVPLVVDCTPIRGVKGRNVRYLSNQAGNVDLELSARGGYPFDGSPRNVSMCSHPFTDLTLHCNDEGQVTVTLCCEDWSEEVIVGSFPQQRLQDIWWGMDDLRRIMIEKGRTIIPLCAKCSSPQFRGHLKKRWFDD